MQPGLCFAAVISCTQAAVYYNFCPFLQFTLMFGDAILTAYVEERTYTTAAFAA